MWGPDAMEFRPERWLGQSNEKPETPLGVYSNLCVFHLLNRINEKNPPNPPPMKGSLSLLEEGVVSAGGLRESVFFFLQSKLEYSSHSLKRCGDPGVLGDPYPGIQFLHPGG